MSTPSTSSTPYNDILYHERPISATHPPLSLAQRAAQFAPYKTLTAYHDSTDSLETSSVVSKYELIPDTDYIEPSTPDFDTFPPDLDTFLSENLDNTPPDSL